MLIQFRWLRKRSNKYKVTSDSLKLGEIPRRVNEDRMKSYDEHEESSCFSSIVFRI